MRSRYYCVLVGILLLTACAGPGAVPPAIPTQARALSTAVPTVAATAAVTTGSPVATTAGTVAPAATAATGQASQSDGYSIGVVLSLSGIDGAAGVAQRDTILSLIDNVNVQQRGLLGPDGGLHPVVVHVEDDGGDPVLAAALAGQLIVDKGVTAIIGTSARLAEVAGAEHVPTLLLNSAPTVTTQPAWAWPLSGENATTVAVEWILAGMQQAGNDRVALRDAIERTQQP